MFLRGKWLIGVIISLFMAFPSAPVWALSADELLNLMVDENVISPDKAAKIKIKARSIEKQEKADEAAKRARELNQVKQEAKAEAKAEAAKEVKAVAKEVKPASDWKAYWNNGVFVEKTDGNFKVKLGGRLQSDFATISSPNRQFVDQIAWDTGRITGSGTFFRRARLVAEGTIYKNIFYKWEYDFAAGSGAGAFTDMFLGLKNLDGIGNIRVGHMKEPISLEWNTSSNFITFMERALPIAFNPGRNSGIMAYNTHFDKRLYWGAGVFYDVNDNAVNFRNYQNWNITARLAGTPYYEDKGRKLVHVGFGYSHQFRNDRTTLAPAAPTATATDAPTHIFASRPEANLAGNTVSTALTPLSWTDNNLINPEFAMVWGPFSVQAEYVLALASASRDADVERNLFLRSSNPSFQGAYAYASYFLTGESRTYNQNGACFDRIKPLNNFDLKGSWGAWELAARWSYLNLQSKNIAGGIQNDFTGGVNWYLTPNVRWMVNYVYANVDNRLVTIRAGMPNNRVQGSVHVAETRFQIDF